MSEVKEVKVMHQGQERVIRGSDAEIKASLEALNEKPKAAPDKKAEPKPKAGKDKE